MAAGAATVAAAVTAVTATAVAAAAVAGAAATAVVPGTDMYYCYYTQTADY